MVRPRSNTSSWNHDGCAPRIERKIIEKNRRNRMKLLYNNLISLLPNYTSMEGLPLPDQIDEAVEYIKSMKNKLETLKQKKESLLPRKRSSQSCTTSDQATNKSSVPLVQVQDIGSNMVVIIANGLQDYSIFHRIIRLLHQDGVEIASANFCINGNSTIQVLHDKVGKSKLCFGDTTMEERLMELICGTSSSEVVDSKSSLWDYEIESYNIWGSETLESIALWI